MITQICVVYPILCQPNT